MKDTEFTALYNKHYSYLVKVAEFTLQNNQRAEDAVQDIFIKILIGKIKPDSSKTILTRFLKRHCRDILMKYNFPIYNDEPVYSDNLEKKELSLRMFTAIQKIKEPIKTTFILRVLCGRTKPEIAKHLKCREATVFDRTKAAITQLRKELKYENV